MYVILCPCLLNTHNHLSYYMLRGTTCKSCSLDPCLLCLYIHSLLSSLVSILVLISIFLHPPLAAVLSLYFSPFISSLCLSLSPLSQLMLSLPPALRASLSLSACFSLLCPSICLFSACFSGLHSSPPSLPRPNTTSSPPLPPFLLPLRSVYIFSPLCLHPLFSLSLYSTISLFILDGSLYSSLPLFFVFLFFGTT